MFSRRFTTFATAGVAAVAVAIGGFAIGSSNSGNGNSGTATAASGTPAAAQVQGSQVVPGHQPGKTTGKAKAPAGAGPTGQPPTGWSAGSGTIIKGAAADKAEAAALAANYTGSVNRVLQLDDGSYVAHMLGTDGPHHVFVSKAFKVTAAV